MIYKHSTDVYNYYGTTPEGKIQPREIKKAPTQRVEKARQRYFDERCPFAQAI